MNRAGSEPENKPIPMWLLAELTYKCPLQCPYCSNPVDMARYNNELSTEDWLRVLRPCGLVYISEPIYAGNFNDILRLFHDEQAVRLAAPAAVGLLERQVRAEHRPRGRDAVEGRGEGRGRLARVDRDRPKPVGPGRNHEA